VITFSSSAARLKTTGSTLIRFTGERERGTEPAAAVLDAVEVADSWPEAMPTMQKTQTHALE
jgi:hypothetical protein